MKKVLQTNKERTSGLYNLALERIRECETCIGGTIPFPKVFEKLCRSFSISKKEAWEILYILQDFGKIKVVPYHGVVIKYD